jgi:phospholipase/carboxylesterase
MKLVHTAWHPGMPGPRPTLVAIHGHGAHAQDLLGLAPMLAAGRLLVLCPEAEFVLQPGMPSYTWFQRDENGERPSEEFERVANLLREWLDEVTERYDVDRERIALLGFSQGGSLAYRLGLAEPARFRGVAALSTWLPDEAMERANRDSIGQLPVLVQHGTDDPLVGIDRGRVSRDRLVELGAQPDYREYPMQHQIVPESLRDLSDWLERIFELGPPEPTREG